MRFFVERILIYPSHTPFLGYPLTCTDNVIYYALETESYDMLGIYLLINLTFFEDLVGCLDRTFEAFAFFKGAVFLPTTVDNANLMFALLQTHNIIF